MATDDRQVLVTGTAPAPADFMVPGNGQIRPKAVFAHFNGTAAASSYLPVLKILSDGGEVVAIAPTTATIAAAGSADVSWFRGLGGAGGSSLQAFLGARIQASSTQTVSTSTNTDLHYQGVYFDTDGMVNLAANDRILTVNTAGLYLVVCETIYDYNSAGRRINNVIQNDYYHNNPIPSQFQASDSRNAIWSTPGENPHTTCTSVGIFQAVAGDFFSSGTYQSSGGNLTCNGGTNAFLSALLIGV